MIIQTTDNLSSLYEADETAWLETMADLVCQGRFEDLDYANLKEYLSDMARRDRREVKSRLRVLLTHLLKWLFQPEKRSKSWQGSINAQRRALAEDAAKGVLRQHAQTVLEQAYSEGLEDAVIETELPESTFPRHCPWALDELLSRDFLKE